MTRNNVNTGVSTSKVNEKEKEREKVRREGRRALGDGYIRGLSDIFGSLAGDGALGDGLLGLPLGPALRTSSVYV